MKIEEIEELWKVDCEINVLDLSKATSDIPKLHSKYYSLYNRERTLLIQLRIAYKKLKFDKKEFLINPTQDRIEEGWEIPSRGKILKTEVNDYIDGDDQLLKLELKIGLQDEKVEFLKDIIKTINARNFLIKNIQDDRRFMAGEY